jgi:hypothetical protein
VGDSIIAIFEGLSEGIFGRAEDLKRRGRRDSKGPQRIRFNAEGMEVNSQGA